MKDFDTFVSDLPLNVKLMYLDLPQMERKFVIEIWKQIWVSSIKVMQ